MLVRTARSVSGAGLVAMVCGCGPLPPDDEPSPSEAPKEQSTALAPGVNGSACIGSPYNCKLRAKGGNRVENDQDGLWAVGDDVVVDGNGDVMGPSTWDHLRFNYGQTRHMKGKTYALAMSTSQGSSGWFPLESVVSEDVLRDRIGEVNAKGAGLGKMACYEVRDTHDTKIAAYKVVYDSNSDHEAVGDYLPLPRKNGQRYVNLSFNVPGFDLGGPAIDIFPAGTKFRRLAVPTFTKKPSIDIPTFKKDKEGRYRAVAGSLKFVYGVVVTADKTKRYGWMAFPALETSTGCP